MEDLPEHRRSRTSWSATKEDIKWPRSPLSGKKMCHLCSLLMKKQSGSPWNEKLKIHTLQLVSSDYIEVKISAESRIVSMFIKTMRISILTSDKFIYRLLKGTKILMPQDTHQPVCCIGGNSPRGMLNHMPSLAVLHFLWSFGLLLLPKSNYQMKWTGGLIQDGSSHIPSYHSSMWKQETCMFITGGQKGKKARACKADALLSLIPNHTSPVMNLPSSILKAIRIWLFTSIIIIAKLFISLTNG